MEKCKNCNKETFMEWRGKYCSSCESEVLRGFPNTLALNRLIDEIQGRNKFRDLFKDTFNKI